MAKYAVGFYSLFNNELIIEFHEAEFDTDAALMHSEMKDFELHPPADGLPVTMEYIKSQCFDCDMMVDVKELP